MTEKLSRNIFFLTQLFFPKFYLDQINITNIMKKEEIQEK